MGDIESNFGGAGQQVPETMDGVTIAAPAFTPSGTLPTGAPTLGLNLDTMTIIVTRNIDINVTNIPNAVVQRR